MSSRWAPKGRRPSGQERGAVAIEFVILLPLLFFIFLATLEVGVAWSARANTTEAVRNSTLVAGTRGLDYGGDLRVLEAAVAEIGATNIDNVVRVLVYDPDVADIGTCLVFANTGGFGSCVVYTQQTVADVAAGTVTIADFGDATCLPVDLDNVWCSANRGSAERIAVRVEYNHDWLTGILPGSGVGFDDHAEIRVLTLD